MGDFWLTNYQKQFIICVCLPMLLYRVTSLPVTCHGGRGRQGEDDKVARVRT